MAQPFNYTIQAPSAFESLVSGLRLGTSLQEMQAQNALRQQQAMKIQSDLEQRQKNQMRLQEIYGKVNTGNASRADWIELGNISGSEAAQKGVWETIGKMDENTVNARIGIAQQFAFGLLRNADLTKKLMDDYLQANQNDPEIKRIRELANTDAEFAGNALLASLPGMGKQGMDAYGKIVDRLFPTAEQAAKTRQATAEAIIKEVEAKFAPETVGAKLGLTQAQIDQAKAAARASDAAARKSGADAERAKAEAAQMAAGVIPADKRPEAERNFRNEYNDRTKVYQDVKASYGRVLSSDDSAVGDLSLIFGYMKMLDPGSVVREGEFATAQNAAGVPERVMNTYNRIVSGERLNSDQRKAFKGQAEQLFKQAGQQEAQVRSGIERIAKGYGLNTANIFYTPEDVAPVAPGAAGAGRGNITQSFSQRPQSAPTPAQTPTPAAGGAQRNVKVDY
jgi:hypothetical protein